MTAIVWNKIEIFKILHSLSLIPFLQLNVQTDVTSLKYFKLVNMQKKKLSDNKIYK